MIHLFHGFLGSPSDFNFLPKRAHIKIHDLRSETLDVGLCPEDILIGYSMGGRFALELAAKVDFQIHKLILINAHPGLNNDEERNQRSSWEDEILLKMNGPEFINEWNALPIFQSDRPLKELPLEELLVWRKVFDRFRLSKQMNYLPLCTEHKDKVLWLIGDKDRKYRALAQKELTLSGLRFRFVNGAHRLFQSETALIEALTQEGIL
jgi:pimeloyl-ACP methyl ester carboxylesterase